MSEDEKLEAKTDRFIEQFQELCDVSIRATEAADQAQKSADCAMETMTNLRTVIWTVLAPFILFVAAVILATAYMLRTYQ